MISATMFMMQNTSMKSCWKQSAICVTGKKSVAFLANIPTRCDYYREDGYGGYEDADYSFDDYKNEVLRHMDENEAWDEEEENVEDDIEEDTDEDADDWFAPADIEEDIETDSFIAVLGRAS